MTSPVLFASSKRRPSRTMSMDSSLLGEEEYYEYYDEDEDEDEEEDDSGGDDGEVGTVVSLEIVGKYSPDSRRLKIERFADKRRRRIWRKRIKYDVRKNFADSRLRVKGRFVRKEDEDQLRDYLNMT
ncbi:hypothetical protein BASA81_003121 [Batrachochytrium salamandrivorans]|nr:hypothetical protein BASA81_003121 [Batrachochytrium salamandrivorans]